MRKAMVAGQFYSEDKTALKDEIGKLMGNLDVTSQTSRDIRAGIVPHAGYFFSGRCASFLYSLLKGREIDTFIVLGTNHSGLGENVSFSIDDFETPLGICENDMEIVEELLIKIKKTQIKVGVNEEAHKNEHSIEVQLPFLQSAQKNFKIVPVLVKDLSMKEIEKLGNIFSMMIKDKEKQGKKIFVLASSDFTHHGRAYGFSPFATNVRENLYKLDNDAVGAILKLDVESFYGKARQTTICGFNSAALCTQIAKNLKLNPEKLCYYTSGDVSGKWDNVVGYAAIGFSC